MFNNEELQGKNTQPLTNRGLSQQSLTTGIKKRSVRAD